MIARNLSMPDIKFIPFRNRPQQTNQPLKKRLPAQLTDCLAQRNFAIDWLYRAQQTLRFSRGSLFLGVALLDKLLTLRMPLTDQNSELVAGTVLLIVTKFNEVYPVTVKKLNALSTNHFSLERYVEFEGSMLATVAFDLSPEDSIYLELAELENKLGLQSQDNIKLAVQNPAIAFRLGSPALLSAIESISIGGLIERKNESRMSMEGAELRQELQRLRSRSPCFNRMVSPSRA